jgi:hypothetical protein
VARSRHCPTRMTSSFARWVSLPSMAVIARAKVLRPLLDLSSMIRFEFCEYLFGSLHSTPKKSQHSAAAMRRLRCRLSWSACVSLASANARHSADANIPDFPRVANCRQHSYRVGREQVCSKLFTDEMAGLAGAAISSRCSRLPQKFNVESVGNPTDAPSAPAFQ